VGIFRVPFSWTKMMVGMVGVGIVIELAVAPFALWIPLFFSSRTSVSCFINRFEAYFP